MSFQNNLGTEQMIVVVSSIIKIWSLRDKRTCMDTVLLEIIKSIRKMKVFA